MSSIGVLGAGSWGTALGVHLAGAGHQVQLWARRAETAERLAEEGTNEEYLPGVRFPPELSSTSDIEALTDAEVVLVVAPSHGFREVLRRFLRALPEDRAATLVSATKGIETDTLARMSQVAFEEGIAADREVRFAVLSGPSFAADLVAGYPTAAVIASRDGDLAAELRDTLSTSTLRLYSSADVVGVELGGASKNVIAIAAGIADGLGLGHNTQALIITRGLHEITRLGVAFEGRARTFSGLAGLGDLVLTCTGSLSRNRRLGYELARGRTLEEITSGTSMVAEGVRNAVALSRLAGRKGVEMPITEQMVAVLYEGKPLDRVIEELSSRELKAEVEL